MKSTARIEAAVILLLFVGALLSGSDARDRPRDWVEFLNTQFEQDAVGLFTAIAEASKEKIWDYSSQDTKATLSFEQFERAFSARRIAQMKNWKVAHKRLHCLDAFSGPQDNDVEAYMISIVRCEEAGRDILVQCIWVFDTTSGGWRYTGHPFGFVEVPLALRYPGIKVRHPDRWPSLGPAIPAEPARPSNAG